MIPPVAPSVATQPQMTAKTPLHEAAQKLETAFLAEMLKSAGLGQSRSSFGGGSGEEQFSSFLVHAQAEAMTKAGGLGLSEMFLKSLMENRT